MVKRSIFFVLLAALAIACSDGDGDESTVPEGSLGDETVREQCTGGSAQAIDVNNDGVPDIRHVFEGQRRRCSEYDMNFDGQIDITRFFAPDGTAPLREEHDFDFDGRIDQISYFENGIMVRKELDTNFDNRIDTWMWCADGLIREARRDRRHTGDADTWEQYENGLISEARYDDNNDGRPEKWEIFENGRLREVRYDTDSDGRPDRSEEIPETAAGPADEPVSCDGRPLQQQAEEAGQTPRNEGGDGEVQDGTVDDPTRAGDEGITDPESPFGTGTGTRPSEDGSGDGAEGEGEGADDEEPLPDDLQLKGAA